MDLPALSYINSRLVRTDRDTLPATPQVELNNVGLSGLISSSALCRLDELGFVVVGQQVTASRTVLECRVVAGDDDAFCHRCGAEGLARGTVARRLAHEPFGWRPTMLLIRVRRYRCSGGRRVWRQNLSRAAAPRAKLSRAAVRWALVGLVVGHLRVARIAEALACRGIPRTTPFWPRGSAS